ncbi:hypothetical protein F4820DRAFT_434014 [Hypoxylon rubiginosum]|uniref:Uncharacterized protein n=1 Tax=Hypoxylon rubiginosum TaxID=110542 RepID=A0ACB9YPQ3_9PEZI|nr:hypothetical protein F4820DRAFT_434014 [Hypoxylon rubiginosum]
MSPLPADQSTPSSSLSVSTTRLVRSVLRLYTRDDSDDAKCHPQPNIDLCEKPDSAKLTSEIVIGTLGGVLVIVTLSLLVFLHYRHKRRDEREWPKNNQELDDYGMGSTTPSSNAAAPGRPKNAYKRPRVDPDDDDDAASNLPPPGARRDSLQSLARSIRGNPDAYRSRPDDISHDMKPVEPLSQL